MTLAAPSMAVGQAIAARIPKLIKYVTYISLTPTTKKSGPGNVNIRQFNGALCAKRYFLVFFYAPLE